MSRENEVILRGRLAVVHSLWNHEREQILEALGVEQIDPNAWSTDSLVEEIKDCIEGRKMLASVSSPEPPAKKRENPEPPANKLAQAEPPANESENPAVTREEIEDWLNDQPLFGT
jgi:hypothetical protein